MLLHDMGPGLADNRPDESADGFEWRTPPLMGIRLVPDNLGGLEFYLHDGRATSVEEAIRLHGGEAQASQSSFSNFSTEEQAALVAFVKSL